MYFQVLPLHYTGCLKPSAGCLKPVFIQLKKSPVFRATEPMAVPIKIGAGREISQLIYCPKYGLDV